MLPNAWNCIFYCNAVSYICIPTCIWSVFIKNICKPSLKSSWILIFAFSMEIAKIETLRQLLEILFPVVEQKMDFCTCVNLSYFLFNSKILTLFDLQYLSTGKYNFCIPHWNQTHFTNFCMQLLPQSCLPLIW